MSTARLPFFGLTHFFKNGCDDSLHYADIRIGRLTLGVQVQIFAMRWPKGGKSISVTYRACWLNRACLYEGDQ